jgi:hypothetical protein
LGLDQRHHISLLEDQWREKLARIKDEIIPLYVSTANRIEHYETCLQRLREMETMGIILIDDTPVRNYVEKFQRIIPLLWAAWKRNLDMSIAEGGKGRAELVTTIQHETGRVLPPEHAGANGQNPIVVVQNGVKPQQNTPKRSIFGPLKDK